jgi:Protein of unknown function (DUF1573)
MYRFCLAVLASVVLALPAPAANWAEGLFDSLTHDFGAVPVGPTLTHSYHIVNNTNATIRIASVRVSCGCTTATALAGVIGPGQSTAVYAQMDSTRFVGPKTVTIYVTFDQPQWAEVRLSISAYGRTDVQIAPTTLAFGAVPRGSAPARSASVTLANGNMQLTSVSADSNYVQLAARQVGRTGYGFTYEVTATLRHDTPAGKWYTDVWLNTNDPSSPRLRVPLTVDVEPALNLSPGGVALGTISVGAATERKVILRGAQPFKVTGFEGTDDVVSVRAASTEARPVHVLTVMVKPTEAGEINRTVKVQTDLPADSVAELGVRATVEMPKAGE